MSFDTFYGYKCIPCHAHSFASLIHSLFLLNKSTLGARLSLFHFTLSRKVSFRLIYFMGPHRHIKGETPSPSSLGARLSLFHFTLWEKSVFARCRGFTLHRFVPYRNNAYEANQSIYSIKLYKKTCTKLMLQKCAGTPRLENCAGTPMLTNCSKNV